MIFQPPQLTEAEWALLRQAYESEKNSDHSERHYVTDRAVDVDRDALKGLLRLQLLQKITRFPGAPGPPEGSYVTTLLGRYMLYPKTWATHLVVQGPIYASEFDRLVPPRQSICTVSDPVIGEDGLYSFVVTSAQDWVFKLIHREFYLHHVMKKTSKIGAYAVEITANPDYGPRDVYHYIRKLVDQEAKIREQLGDVSIDDVWNYVRQPTEDDHATESS